MLKLFAELDNVYNSNLFAQHELDMMEVHDPTLIEEIVDGLYRQTGNLVQYDFNAITADILGAVYEQYLSFKANDPDAKVDTGKSKKAQIAGHLLYAAICGALYRAEYCWQNAGKWHRPP
ncbi:MAG: hypothetical protein Q9P01_01885 [Anaerolineae bacterium]|nr:hypothetical protein [Anaerolineae bacterium]